MIAENQKVPILTFHSIDTSGSVISTHPETFRLQMKFLRDDGFDVVTTGTLNEKLIAGTVTAKTIALTFDDGFENFYTAAFPILQEHGLPATVFIISDYCGKYNDWEGNLPTLNRQKLMSWERIRELNKYGIEFASHSASHADLTRLSPKKLANELTGSKIDIEDKLGVQVANFAYPYGRFNDSVKLETRKHYEMAFSTKLGKANFADDNFALKRLDMYYLSNINLFQLMLTKRFDSYMSLRQLMRNLKSLYYNG